MKALLRSYVSDLPHAFGEFSINELVKIKYNDSKNCKN